MQKFILSLAVLTGLAASPALAAPLGQPGFAAILQQDASIEPAQYRYDRREAIRRQEFRRRQAFRRQQFQRRQAYRRGYRY